MKNLKNIVLLLLLIASFAACKDAKLTDGERNGRNENTGAVSNAQSEDQPELPDSTEAMKERTSRDTIIGPKF